MNKLRERLVSLPVSISSSDLDEIMEIIEEHLEETWYDARDMYRPSMCDWQYIYDGWEDYYKSVLKYEDEK